MLVWQPKSCRSEARQCYVVAGGSSMVGRVAVWRSPCVQPSDIEVWEAVQWPGDLKAVPTNCIICSVRGKGITALAGGDSDGDDVAVTLNQDLVEFVEHAEAAVAQLDWEQACKPKKELEVEARKLFSTTADRSPTYLQHMLNVPTPNVRGQATALAEKCQQAVIWTRRLTKCTVEVKTSGLAIKKVVLINGSSLVTKLPVMFVQGEFSRTERIFGEDVIVTTNSVEGLLAGSSNIYDSANMVGADEESGPFSKDSRASFPRCAFFETCRDRQGDIHVYKEPKKSIDTEQITPTPRKRSKAPPGYSEQELAQRHRRFGTRFSARIRLQKAFKNVRTLN
ncbi:hypothetical protein AK812_SmicGene29702 [Symbiodinium microadriaticum]|uniref:RNA-dependent RNA polymerase n=1 Tax=Symbiodinium microadriaticum TaxID=2951 RepID=A0A1Q9D128_SYMMI|nr:hypothetical protein AK812_SmicGene29702 [Symbiodinium microadriaticum]